MGMSLHEAVHWPPEIGNVRKLSLIIQFYNITTSPLAGKSNMVMIIVEACLQTLQYWAFVLFRKSEPCTVSKVPIREK